MMILSISNFWDGIIYLSKIGRNIFPGNISYDKAIGKSLENFCVVKMYLVYESFGWHCSSQE